MNRAYYSDSIQDFILKEEGIIISELVNRNQFSLLTTQRSAWQFEIDILKQTLEGFTGKLYLEFDIPRMGKRADAIVIIGSIIFVLEFKIGSEEYNAYAMDQVWDYALDLHHFHGTSHDKLIIPILVITGKTKPENQYLNEAELIMHPLKCSTEHLAEYLRDLVNNYDNGTPIDIFDWENGHYHPTPTIIEAATALYGKHSVEEITRSESGAENLSITSSRIAEIIQQTQRKSQKAICFVTGVPGAGKTLVGLDIATRFIDKDSDLHSVFLSGNGPLVSVLQEALYKDRKQKMKEGLVPSDRTFTRSVVKSFIQNVHHFRDSCIVDPNPPHDHVAIFDEAQRAWNQQMTSNFMKRKKNIPDFEISEPEFLISCMDRHQDWAVIVCLVGGGQEINTGEAGISEWLDSIERKFPNWRVYISDHLTDNEYRAEQKISEWNGDHDIVFEQCLHLAVSIRSFRAEKVSDFVKQLLDMKSEQAKTILSSFIDRYPVVLTRDLLKAKSWIKGHAQGSERYGIVVSSQAERLKPHAIFVKAPVDPINWFLKGKDDVRSSYYMEDVATEFMIQGLELDWACVVCDGDFRYTANGWDNWSFKGSRWERINKSERQLYLKNAYRVLLTRARQGMVIVVPEGDREDHTRKPEYYDPIFRYFKELGIEEL